MNLFSKHKKFEEQLKEQLGDMEYKPSTSLWDRIDSDITKDGFETGIQNSLENFEQVPYSDTWDKIAAELPAEKIPNTRLKYYGLGALAFLFAIGVWVGYEWNQYEDTGVIVAQAPILAEANTENSSNNNSNGAKLKRTTNTTTKSYQSGTVIESERVPIVEDAAKQPTALTKVKVPEAVAKMQKSTPSNRSLTPKQPRLHNRISVTENAPVAFSERRSIPAPPNALVSKEQPIESIPIVHEQPLIKRPVVPAENSSPVNGTAAHTDAREVTESVMQKDTSTQAVSAKSAQQDELTRFSISILAGAQLCFMNYAKPSSPQFNFDQNIALRKKLERADVDWSGGFLLDYRISDKWMISTGLMMTNFSQQFDYNTVAPTDTVNPNETFGAVYESTDSVITGNGYSNRIKYSWTEIPVLINYTIHRGQRWDVDMQAGASFAIINGVDAGMISYDNKGVFALKDKDAFPQIKNSVFVSLMPQVSYRFGQNVSVGFVPTVKYSVTSMIGNDRWVQQHPYFVGLNVCLRKRF